MDYRSLSSPLGVGGVHGDGIRNMIGNIDMGTTMGNAFGVFYFGTVGNVFAGPIVSTTNDLLKFDASRIVPTAPVNRPKAWGALACCYLGEPAS